MTDRANDPAFIYFPTNYRWSMGLLLCLSAAPSGGAEIDEINRIGRALKDRVGDDNAWFEEWARMGNVVEARGRDAEKKGHKLTAAACLMRAAHYYQIGERFLQHGPRSPAVYKKAVKSFADGAAMLKRPRIESVEVPYGDKTLPALFVHPAPEAAQAKPAPAMVFFDGFDITKEIQYFKGVPELAARGIACLIVDGPGNGESVRFRDLPLIAETEKYGTAAYEYLASRKEVDPKRIGVMAISLGGYYAPRAASLEPLLHGGGQERGRRSGTPDVAGAVGLATALELAALEVSERGGRATGEAVAGEASRRSEEIRDAFIQAVLARVEGARLTGDPVARHPGHASFTFAGTSGEAVLLGLERRGVISSSGSACAAGSDEPSPVLLALGIDPALAQTAVRFTFARPSTGSASFDPVALADAVAAAVADVAP